MKNKLNTCRCNINGYITSHEPIKLIIEQKDGSEKECSAYRFRYLTLSLSEIIFTIYSKDESISAKLDTLLAKYCDKNSYDAGKSCYQNIAITGNLNLDFGTIEVLEVTELRSRVVC